MTTQLALPEAKLKHLNEPARDELARATSAFAADLVAEAGRLEATVSSGQGDPQITSSHIVDAETLLRRGYSKRPTPWSMRLLQGGSIVGGVVSGVMADTEYLQDQSHLIVFVVVLAITVATSVAAVFRD